MPLRHFLQKHLVDKMCALLKYVSHAVSFSVSLCSLLYSSAWLTEYDDPMIEMINNRIEGVTGLEMDTAEELQVKKLFQNQQKTVHDHQMKQTSFPVSSVRNWFFLHVFVCRLQIMVLEVNTNLTLTLEGYVLFLLATVNVLLH